MNIFIKEVNPTNNAIAKQLEVATTEFVQSQINNASFAVAIVDLASGVNSIVSGVYAPLNNPQFSGVPTAPTAATNNNSNQIANTAFVRNAMSSYLPVDSDGRLLSAALPENLDARLSVLSDTDTVLSQVILYPGELAAPTDRSYLRKGDGIAPGGTIVGQGNAYIQDFIPTNPPIYVFNTTPNSGIPLFNQLTIVPSQSIYSLINNSGTFYNYPGLWVNSLSFSDSLNVPGITGSMTISHVVGVTSTVNFSTGSNSNINTLILPDLKVILGGGITSSPPNNSVTTISAPELEYTTAFSLGGGSLSAVNFNKLETVAGSFAIAGSSATNLNNLSLPKLKYITGATTIGSTIGGVAAITKFDVPELMFMSSLTINNSPPFSGIYLPSIQAIAGNISCSAPATTNLADINFGSSLYYFNGNITCTGQKLTSTSIENVFVRLSGLNGTGNTVAYSGSRSINFSGGTSAGLASLSSVALAARTALINRGITVTLNA